MASVMRGEDRRSDWLFAGNHYLPSNLPLMRQFSVDRNSGIDKTGPTRTTRHQRIPSASFLMEEQLSWLDDLLDDEEIKSGSHRRSASDSFSFYDASESLYGISDIVEEDEVKSFNLEKSRGCNTLSQERCQQNLFPESNQSNHSLSVNASKESFSSESSKTQRRGNYPSMTEHASTSHGAILPETVGGGAPEQLACEQNELSWLDDLLDDSENLSRKVGHRRSASDSFTFLKAPGYLHKITGIAEEEEFDCNTTHQQFRFYSDKHSPSRSQPVSAYNLQKQHSLPVIMSDSLHSLSRSQPVSAYNLQKQHSLPVIMSDSLFNSNNRLELVRPFVHEKSISDVSRIHRTIGVASDVRLLQTTSKEVQNFGDAIPGNSRQGELKPTGETTDPNIDPQRAKRTLANRQSAQRSRVRKLMYIAELEGNVDALQTEVSALSLQVAYLEHQRVLLNVDNNTTKQCIARLAKDKKLKDAQNEALKFELQKLRKLYQFQLQQHEHESERTLKKPNACHNNQQRFCPPAFDIIPEEFSKLHLGSQKKS